MIELVSSVRDECHAVLTKCLQRLQDDPTLATRETLQDLVEFSKLLGEEGNCTTVLRREYSMFRLSETLLNDTTALDSIQLVFDWANLGPSYFDCPPISTVLNDYIAPLFRFFPNVETLYLDNMRLVGTSSIADLEAGFKAFKGQLLELTKLETIEHEFVDIQDAIIAFKSGIQALSPGEMNVRLSESMKYFGDEDVSNFEELLRERFLADRLFLRSDAWANPQDKICSLMIVLCGNKHLKVPTHP